MVPGLSARRGLRLQPPYSTDNLKITALSDPFHLLRALLQPGRLVGSKLDARTESFKVKTLAGEREARDQNAVTARAETPVRKCSGCALLAGHVDAASTHSKRSPGRN